MNRGTIQKAAAAALSLIMIAGGLPWNTMVSYADSSVQNQAEDSASSESSVSNDAEGRTVRRNRRRKNRSNPKKRICLQKTARIRKKKRYRKMKMSAPYPIPFDTAG